MFSPTKINILNCLWFYCIAILFFIRFTVKPLRLKNNTAQHFCRADYQNQLLPKHCFIKNILHTSIVNTPIVERTINHLKINICIVDRTIRNLITTNTIVFTGTADQLTVIGAYAMSCQQINTNSFFNYLGTFQNCQSIFSQFALLLHFIFLSIHIINIPNKQIVNNFFMGETLRHFCMM